MKEEGDEGGVGIGFEVGGVVGGGVVNTDRPDYF